MNKIIVIVLVLAALNIVIMLKNNAIEKQKYQSLAPIRNISKISNLDFDYSKQKTKIEGVVSLDLIFEKWSDWEDLEEMFKVVSLREVESVYIKVYNDSIYLSPLLSRLSVRCEKAKILMIEGKTFIKKNKPLEEGDTNRGEIEYTNTIVDFPHFINEFPQLEVLLINNTHIYQLSDKIGELEELKQVNLANNKLKKIPKILENLPQLEVLVLAHNELGLMEDEVLRSYNFLELLLKNINERDFKSLKYLDLSYNKLKHGFVNRDILSLTKLNLSHNQIEVLHESILNLKQLKSLDLSFNKFKEFPRKLRKISSLKAVYFNNNNVHMEDSYIDKFYFKLYQ